MEILIRADDFGFCPAINYGIMTARATGLVQSAGLMVNMPGTQHAVCLIQSQPQLCLGLHVNLVIGQPMSPKTRITSLVDDRGRFYSTKYYRSILAKGGEIFMNRQEVYQETENQVIAFYALTGRFPAYIDTHAVPSPNLFQVMAEIAEKYDLIYFSHEEKYSRNISTQPHRLLNPAEFYASGGQPQHYFTQTMKHFSGSKDDTYFLVLHPGYLEQYVLDSSSYTDIRMKDVALCESEANQKWLAENRIKLISHRNLLKR